MTDASTNQADSSVLSDHDDTQVSDGESEWVLHDGRVLVATSSVAGLELHGDTEEEPDAQSPNESDAEEEEEENEDEEDGDMAPGDLIPVANGSGEEEENEEEEEDEEEEDEANAEDADIEGNLAGFVIPDAEVSPDSSDAEDDESSPNEADGERAPAKQMPESVTDGEDDLDIARLHASAGNSLSLLHAHAAGAVTRRSLKPTFAYMQAQRTREIIASALGSDDDDDDDDDDEEDEEDDGELSGDDADRSMSIDVDTYKVAIANESEDEGDDVDYQSPDETGDNDNKENNENEEERKEEEEEEEEEEEKDKIKQTQSAKRGALVPVCGKRVRMPSAAALAQPSAKKPRSAASPASRAGAVKPGLRSMPTA